MRPHALRQTRAAADLSRAAAPGKMQKKMVSFHKLFAALDAKNEGIEDGIAASRRKLAPKTAIERHMGGFQTIENMTGIKRIQLCRQGLEALDRRGW
jgi:hypothetical protein